MTATLLLFYLVKQDLEVGRLVRLFPEYSISTHPLYLVYASKADKLKRRRIFKELLLDWLKTQRDVFQTV
jgi:DNA-binding transcriptional LysR family regulator